MFNWLRWKRGRHYEITDWWGFTKAVRATGRYGESDYMREMRKKKPLPAVVVDIRDSVR